MVSEQEPVFPQMAAEALEIARTCRDMLGGTVIICTRLSQQGTRSKEIELGE